MAAGVHIEFYSFCATKGHTHIPLSLADMCKLQYAPEKLMNTAADLGHELGQLL